MFDDENQWQEMGDSGLNYRAFLLRCWQEASTDGGGEPAWRFTVIQLDGSHAKKGFACLEDLVAHLRFELN